MYECLIVARNKYDMAYEIQQLICHFWAPLFRNGALRQTVNGHE